MARFPRAGRDAAKLPQGNLEDQLAALSISSQAANTPESTAASDSGSDNAGVDVDVDATPKKPTGKAAIHANIIEYFDTTYGTQESKLAAWQKLCEHVGVEPQPSITKCKKEMKKVYINIVDFVAAQQAGPPFKRFTSYQALKSYTIRTRKFFPLKKAKVNPLLKWALITVF